MHAAVKAGNCESTDHVTVHTVRYKVRCRRIITAVHFSCLVRGAKVAVGNPVSFLRRSHGVETTMKRARAFVLSGSLPFFLCP